MHLFINNTYIPQTKQHDPKWQMLFHLGNVTNLLDVTLTNPLPHPLSPPPFHFVLLKLKISVAKQHPTNNTYIQIHTYIHTYIQTYIHTYIHTYIYTYINTCKYIPVCWSDWCRWPFVGDLFKPTFAFEHQVASFFLFPVGEARGCSLDCQGSLSSVLKFYYSIC